MTQSVAFILKGYPRLSETFIAQEIHALERRGLDIYIYSLRKPTDRYFHPIHDEINAPVTYLPEYLYKEPLRLWKAWRSIRNKSGYQIAKRALWADLKKSFQIRHLRRFGQAVILAHELPEQIQWLHAHFMHAASSTARYVAKILDMPWSLSAHAIDIWAFPEWDNAQKLKECAWAVTCTRRNADYLSSLAPDHDPVELVYHGLDFSRFPAPSREPSRRDGREAADPVRLLSVGRAVEKKGYTELFEALSQLPEDLHWRLMHIGGGDLMSSLQKQARRLGIADHIDWRGTQRQADVLEAYRESDVFVLASKVARNGDRDGLPNVLMEAMSQGLTCLSTKGASAAEELIADGNTGVLVPADDIAALSQALARLIREPHWRESLGQAGRNHVRRQFAFEAGIDRLAEKFGLPVIQAEKQGAA